MIQKEKSLDTPTSVNRVLSENYFYDKDNLIENFLRDRVEGPAAPAIEKLLNAPKNIDQDDRLNILRFICVQMNRTPSALSSNMKMIDNFSGQLIKQIGDANGFDSDITKDIKLIINNPKAVLQHQVLDGALNWPLLDDLRFHLINNETDVEFVISDHPIVTYNWFLRDSNELTQTALTSHGLMVFMPLSDKALLCLYDAKIYKVGEKNNDRTVVRDRTDVYLLNELQFRNRESYIVFSSKKMDEYVMGSCNQIPASSLHVTHSWGSELELSGNAEMRSNIVGWRSQYCLKRWLSFCKIKRNLRKKKPLATFRRPDIVEAHKYFTDKAKGKVDSTFKNT